MRDGGRGKHTRGQKQVGGTKQKKKINQIKQSCTRVVVVADLTTARRRSTIALHIQRCPFQARAPHFVALVRRRRPGVVPPEPRGAALAVDVAHRKVAGQHNSWNGGVEGHVDDGVEEVGFAGAGLEGLGVGVVLSRSERDARAAFVFWGAPSLYSLRLPRSTPSLPPPNSGSRVVALTRGRHHTARARARANRRPDETRSPC